MRLRTIVMMRCRARFYRPGVSARHSRMHMHMRLKTGFASLLTGQWLTPSHSETQNRIRMDHHQGRRAYNILRFLGCLFVIDVVDILLV
jgi:hypothetical protein